MKKKNNKDISILLYALLLFSFAIGWVYSRNSKEQDIFYNQIETLADTQETPKTPDAQKAPEEVKPEETKKIEEEKPVESTIKIPEMPTPPTEVVFDPKTVKDEEITVNIMLNYVKTLIRSGSINHLIRLLKAKCPKKIIVETLNKIIQNGDLPRYKKRKIIFAIGAHYEKDKKIQAQIFDILSNATNKKYLEIGQTPLLFSTIKTKESKAIPALIEWAKKSDRPEIKNLEKEALDYAAKNDFGQELKDLNKNGVKIDPKTATELLWINLNANKTDAASNLIETLKNLGANLNSQDNKTKFTALILAIKNKNLPAVKKLLQFGADPKLGSEDKAIGFPLQIARELKLLEIEDALRASGARD